MGCNDNPQTPMSEIARTMTWFVIQWCDVTVVCNTFPIKSVVPYLTCNGSSLSYICGRH